MSTSFFGRDPGAARFLSGARSEAEQLFGCPLPRLPPGEREGGRDVYFVRFHQGLRPLIVSFLKCSLAQFGLRFSDLPARAQARARSLQEYESALLRVLRSVRATDRRRGLANLFWLAHSREVALALREIEAKNDQAARARYSIQPLLSQFYRRVDQAVSKELDPASAERSVPMARDGESSTLADAILDDGLAFCEATIEELDVSCVLRDSRRFRISAEAFADILGVLEREVERRLRKGDEGLLARIERQAGGAPRARELASAEARRLALNQEVMTYLFADVWGTGAHLLSSERLKAEAERSSPGVLVDAFLELVSVLKRFELIAGLRERILLPMDAELEERVRRGFRLYDFSESAQVLNNAVNATILFLDLRGFTQTSEGVISERDLTRELYAVFDAFVPHVRRFGGTVDKFLGDGMMIHFGTEFREANGPLQALRTAILCQESLAELRGLGKTRFKMGVSIHYGRVYLARFMVDERETQNTIIGRNVNLAGRLSSAAKKPLEEDEGPTDPGLPKPERANELSVTVGADGALLNEGIAISRAAFVQIEQQVELAEVGEAGLRRLDFHDLEIGRHVRFRYVGDAKFKGVSASLPVFEVDYTS